MRNRKAIFLSLLFASLFMGCVQGYAAGIDQESDLDTNESVLESDGVLDLGQVLALTLMNNPELKVFSLETRAAQARELQAGLWL